MGDPVSQDMHACKNYMIHFLFIICFFLRLLQPKTTQGYWKTYIRCLTDYLLWSWTPDTYTCLHISLMSIVRIFETFVNIFGIKHEFPKYLKVSCCLGIKKHFSLWYFQKKYCGLNDKLKLSGLPRHKCVKNWHPQVLSSVSSFMKNKIRHVFDQVLRELKKNNLWPHNYYLGH